MGIGMNCYFELLFQVLFSLLVDKPDKLIIIQFYCLNLIKPFFY